MVAVKAKVHDELGEVADVETAILRAVKLATHLRPDLDALLSIWMCQRVRETHGLEPLEVLFIPASTRGVEEGILAVDIGRGKGLQRFGDGLCIKQSEIGGSAAMAIYRALPADDRDIMEAIVMAISDADECGENIHAAVLKKADLWETTETKNQILTTNLWYIHQSASLVLNDRQLLKYWYPLFDGMLLSGIRRRDAVEAARNAQYLCGRRFAVLPHGAPRQTTGYAFKKGADIVLFSSRLGGNRWTLGLNRRPRSRKARQCENENDYVEIDITSLGLEKEMPDIFVHDRGFMAGWTSKAPLIATEKEFQEKKKKLIEAIMKALTK